MLIIDGESFDIPIMSLKRKADFLDKYAERTEDGVLHRELIGVYYNYDLELGSSTNTVEYQRLWDKLTEPEEYHSVTVPDDDGVPLSFTAYFAGVGDELRKDHGSKTYWKGLRVRFIARSPART